MAQTFFVLILALVASAHDPMGLVAPAAPAPQPSSPPRGPRAPEPPLSPAPARPAKSGLVYSPATDTEESAPRWAKEVLATSPSMAVTDPVARKYLLCASLFDVNTQILDTMIHFRRPGEERELDQKVRIDIKHLGPALLKRGRAMAPSVDQTAYSRVKAATDKWAWKLADQTIVGDMPEYAGCRQLPEVEAALTGR